MPIQLPSSSYIKVGGNDNMNYYNPGHYNYFHQRDATKYGPTVLPQTLERKPPMKPMQQ